MLALLFACSQAIEVPPEAVVGLEVQPAAQVIITGPSGGEAVQFSASARTEDGALEPVALVEWSVSNLSAGTIDEAGLFLPSTNNGGETWVTARFNGVEAQASLSVIYQERIVEEGANPGLFTGGASDGGDLWLYPEDGVNIPRNTPSIDFQWSDLAADTYRLELRSASTDLTVFTTAPGWEAAADLWTAIVATNAGGEVELDLTAATADGLVSSAPLRVAVNRMDAAGSILYWSTSTQGFMKIPYGDESEEFLTVNQTGRCQGCHAVSSEGLFAFTYDGGNGPLGVKTLGLDDVMPPENTTFFGNFKSFSPDSDYLITTYGGALLLYDGRTSEYLHDVPLPEGTFATHVDWSPDGDRLVVTLHDGGEGWADWVLTSGGRIAVMDHLGDGGFGTPEVLHDPDDPFRAYYPTWSPDGRWIAFNVSTGDAYDDPDAELWVIDGDGGDPVLLEAANQVGELSNSWPRWGPLPDDDILWLTFASRRAYGRYSDPELPNPQIWVAGFDPRLARQGEDPSWPAFWLPGQDIIQNNHIPLWADIP